MLYEAGSKTKIKAINDKLNSQKYTILNVFQNLGATNTSIYSLGKIEP